ncbi:hypothetical protein, partial [Mesomycoplasma ovipneumoniae]|uniref:hypothetical protein n=1 Tax=Mesomycoplasma ovipneumoniae TaxID=29562 RepID=UPI003080A4BD
MGVSFLLKLGQKSQHLSVNFLCPSLKTALLDESNKIKNAENALESFSFFEKKGGNLEKLDFSDSEFS